MNFFNLPEKIQRKIIIKAVKESNKAQRELLKKYKEKMVNNVTGEIKENKRKGLMRD